MEGGCWASLGLVCGWVLPVPWLPGRCVHLLRGCTVCLRLVLRRFLMRGSIAPTMMPARGGSGIDLSERRRRGCGPWGACVGRGLLVRCVCRLVFVMVVVVESEVSLIQLSIAAVVLGCVAWSGYPSLLVVGQGGVA